MNGGTDLVALAAAAERSRRAGQLAEARAQFARLAAAAAAAGDDEALVAAALGVGGLWVYEQRGFLERAELAHLWSTAQRLTPPASLAARRLAVRISAEAVYEGGPLEAVIDAARDVVARGDDGAAAEALSLLHHVQLGPAWAASRLDLAGAIVRHATRAGDPVLALMGLCWRTVDLYLVGNPSADQSLQELHERAEDAACAAVAFVADVMGAMRLARAGKFQEAEAAAAHACVRGQTVGDSDAPVYFGAMLSALRWWQGRGAEIVDEVRTLAASPLLGSNAQAYMASDAALSASLGDTDGATEALARLNAVGLGTLPWSSSWLTTQLLATEAAYLVGDASTAARAAELIRPYARLPVMPSLAVVCLGSAERALGLAAATCADLDAAVVHLEEALRVDQLLGSRPMATLTESALAAVLTARGATGDADRAATLAHAAEARASQIGMKLPASPSWLARPRRTSHRVQLAPSSAGWKLSVDGRVTLLGGRIGTTYLAALLAAPSADVHVLQLVFGVDTTVNRTSLGQPVLDQHALRDLEKRVSELETAGDVDELEAIRATLRSATGRRGRPRDFPTDQERARTAVRKALRRAIESIARTEPAFAEHLSRQVTTGYTCRYDSAPGWAVEFARSSA